MPTINAINSKNPFLQIVSTSLGTVQTITNTIPADDTIPQNTEGDQVLSLSITPKFSTSTLEITFSGFITSTGNNAITVALFQDSTANALAAKSFAAGVATNTQGTLQHVMTSGTTSSTTFNIRIGPSANTAYVNGNSAGTQLYGGVATTILTILEHL